MTGHRGPIRACCVAIGAVVLVVALSACNPLVNQTTHGYEGIPPWIPASSSSERIDFVSPESGWLEIQVIDAANPAVAVSGRYRYVDRDGCGGELPRTWVWSEGASLGFQRLAWIDPGAQFFVTAAGSSDPIHYNIRVVNDAGEPVGDVTPYVPPEGQFEEVGWPIC